MKIWVLAPCFAMINPILSSAMFLHSLGKLGIRSKRADKKPRNLVDRCGLKKPGNNLIIN
jgi:hypothetical protein